MYVGRFAPSPSGPLHLGSLTVAVAGYLQARAAGGSWLVRIDDIDPPREMPGAARHILTTLNDYGMQPDAPPIYQSDRLAHYQAALDRLQQAGRCFACRCTRKQLQLAREQSSDGHYPGTCHQLDLPTHNHAIRLRQRDVDAAGVEATIPTLRGVPAASLRAGADDFVLRRRDGLFGYHLATVVDDFHDGITEIVRGADLLPALPDQIALMSALGYPTPDYLHVPVVADQQGRKLSKQNHAAAVPSRMLAETNTNPMPKPVPESLDNSAPDDAALLATLQQVWSLLGQERLPAAQPESQQTPLPTSHHSAAAGVARFWQQAIPRWEPRRIPRVALQEHRR